MMTLIDNLVAALDTVRELIDGLSHVPFAARTISAALLLELDVIPNVDLPYSVGESIFTTPLHDAMRSRTRQMFGGPFLTHHEEELTGDPTIEESITVADITHSAIESGPAWAIALTLMPPMRASMLIADAVRRAAYWAVNVDRQHVGMSWDDMEGLRSLARPIPQLPGCMEWEGLYFFADATFPEDQYNCGKYELLRMMLSISCLRSQWIEVEPGIDKYAPGDGYTSHDVYWSTTYRVRRGRPPVPTHASPGVSACTFGDGVIGVATSITEARRLLAGK